MRRALPLALAVLAFLPSAGLAQPQYMRVTGVAAGDALDVRAAPDAASEDLGDLPHDAAAIEVTGVDGSGAWARILWEDGTGWLAMAFLEPDTLDMIGGTALPAGLQCGGTEPFWSLRLSQAGAVYSDITGAAFAMALKGTRVAEGHAAFPLAMQHAGTEGGALSAIQPQTCSDDMSEREYPYGITLVLETGGGSRFLAGCCWLPLEAGLH